MMLMMMLMVMLMVIHDKLLYLCFGSNHSSQLASRICQKYWSLMFKEGTDMFILLNILTTRRPPNFWGRFHCLPICWCFRREPQPPPRSHYIDYIYICSTCIICFMSFGDSPTHFVIQTATFSPVNVRPPC